MGGNSIKKWNMNSGNADPVSALGIKEFQIVNAGNFITTDYACWASEVDNVKTWLKVDVEKDAKRLTISSTDGSAL